MAAFFNRLAYLGTGIAATGAIANSVLYNVDGGHRAIIFDTLQGGVQDYVRGEGTHFLIPVFQTPIIFDVRSSVRNVPVMTPSKDLQNVSVTLRILYRPNIAALPKIYRNLGVDYQERVLPSIANEVLKAIVAQFDASELITQRDSVSAECREALTQRAKDFDINLDDIAITHLNFSSEFERAVELKQVAQQDAERARFAVEQAEQEKLANIIRAEGDSKAAELISKSLRDHGQGLIELRKIEAAKEIATVMARSPNVAYLPSTKNGGMLMNMNVG